MTPDSQRFLKKIARTHNITCQKTGGQTVDIIK